MKIPIAPATPPGRSCRLDEDAAGDNGYGFVGSAGGP
jgi:hypothetical protein